MANTLLTIDMITREAVRLFRNSNAFIRNINRQYDGAFGVEGAKIGDTLRIRLPNDYVVRTGPALDMQATAETYTSLTVSNQKGVDVGFTSVDLTLSLDDFSTTVLAPMMNNLVGEIAVDVMSGAEGGACNWVANLSGAGAVIPPTAEQWLQAGAVLDNNSTPRGEGGTRRIVMDPITQARTVSSLSGLFNPAGTISSQYKTGTVSENTLGFDWYMDQTVLKHTTGTFSAGGTVNGAGQTGATLVVNATTGTFEAGDIITIAGVNAVNRIFKTTTGELRQFVVTADTATGATSIPIYPAIIAPIGGAKQQYQTVTASPGNGAVVALVNTASEVYRMNLAFAPDAITLATADLRMPKNVEAARHMFDGVSMRMVSDYVIATDTFATRLDVLYGYLFIRPEWVCIVADSIAA